MAINLHHSSKKSPLPDKSRNDSKPASVLYRIFSGIYYMRHLEHTNPQNIQLTYINIQEFLRRFSPALFILFSTALFFLGYAFFHRSYIIRYAMSAVYSLLFPLALYFTIKASAKAAALNLPEKQHAQSKFLPVLLVIYPAIVIVMYYLCRENPLPIDTFFLTLKGLLVFSMLSFFVSSCFAFVKNHTCYSLVLCSAGAFFALMKVLAISTILLDNESYYFLLNLIPAFYFIGLVLSVVVSLRLHKGKW